MQFLSINKFKSKTWIIKKRNIWILVNFEDNTKNVMIESDTEFVIEKSIVDKWNTTIGDQKQHKLFLEPSIYITSLNSNDAVNEEDSSDEEL